MGGSARSWPKLDENSNVLVYLTGHGGDNFFKFQDGEELMSNDVASVFSQMYEMKRYNEILFISDTCQAFTMADEIRVPNVFSVGSSLKDQNSYASHSDTDVGQSVIDRYSKIIKDFVDDAVTLTSDSSSQNKDPGTASPFDESTVAVMERFNLHDALVRIPMNHGDLGPNSHVGHADHLCSRRMNKVPMSDFFAATSAVRESWMNPRYVKSSIWMGDASIAAVSRGSRQMNFDSEKECTTDGEPKEHIGTSEQRGAESEEKVVHPKGISPFGPKFLSLAAGFLVCVMLSSRAW